CSTKKFLEDAAINIGSWLMQKASVAFRKAINNAIIAGSGVGQPQGLLTGGVPRCLTSPLTPPGSVTWQDAFQLMMQLPAEWHDGAVYLANQNAIAMMMTWSTADGRPIFASMIENRPALRLFGWPLIPCSQFPNIERGAIPLIALNPRAAYTLVTRRSTSLQVDPYSFGYCTGFKFDTRVGGACTCPNAARALVIQ